MPIKLNYRDNTSTDNIIEDAYGVISELHLDLNHKSIVFAYDIYRDEDAYRSNREKIGVEVVRIKDGEAAVYGEAPLITPAVEPTYSDPPLISSGYFDGETWVDQMEYGEPDLIDPGTPAIYGDAPILKNRVPSFNEVIAANIPIYVNLAKAVYDVAITQTVIFQSGVFVAPSAYELR